MSASRLRGMVSRLQPRRWSPTSGLAAIAAGSLLALLLAAPVLGHAELTTSDPEDTAVLATPPTVITLTFSEGLDQAKSSFKLNGPAGTVGAGKPTRQGGKVMTLDGLTLAPGAYSIAWTAAATDGHVERGKLSFSVSEPTPAATGPAPAASAAAPATEAPAPAAPATETPASAAPATEAPSTEAPASASGTDVLIPIGVGLVLVTGLGGFLFSRSRRA